ncbi:MAG: patatin-like phospholipase family protein [Ferruginibacter sp.]
MKILLFILCPLFGFAQLPSQYTNLALEGGGTRGVAYAGVFKVLEEKGVLQNIENVAGSSAGAIAGLMLAIGYNAKEIDSILMSLPFQKFNDGRGGLYGKYKRVKKKFGIYKGDHFENWLRETLRIKTGNAALSFRGLHEMKSVDKRYRDFYCTATNISRQRLEVFSFTTSPDLSLAVAVRISGGIPLYFTPVALDDSLHKIKKGDTVSYINYYVDGGMLCNYPISMFDSCKAGGQPLLCNELVFNRQTLGIKLEREEQIEMFMKDSVELAYFRPKNIKDFLAAFGNLTTETMARKYPGLENEKGRTIYVSYGNSDARIKKMSDANKRMLYDNGVKGAMEFFNKNKTL